MKKHKELRHTRGHLLAFEQLNTGWLFPLNHAISLWVRTVSDFPPGYPGNDRIIGAKRGNYSWPKIIRIIRGVRGRAGRPARPRTQHDCHHDTKVKPEAATAVIKLLMMGGKTPETCWAVNKRQDKKLKKCCIWLVIYLNCTIMHGLTNLKLYI